MPESGRQYRHEFKYIISAAQIPLLKYRIKGLLRPDPHTNGQGSYTIRSLYFDNLWDGCYYENENGTDPREKFRIRIYNHNTDRIMLECKRKERGKTLKTACPLTLEQARLLMEGKVPGRVDKLPPLLQRLSSDILCQGMRPVVIVEYDRIPFVYRNGNVRITLDTNICASTQIERFFDPVIDKRPVMFLGTQLLEVKYDEYLPDYIYRSLQLSNLAQTAFSKFYICRKLTK